MLNLKKETEKTEKSLSFNKYAETNLKQEQKHEVAKMSKIGI